MVDVEGSDATRYRCPPGTLGAGDWTNVMGSTCNLGPGRDTVSDITQATSGAKPKAPKRGGLRDRAVGVLDRFAERARPQEDLERRRSILTPSRTPEGSTSGRLPDRRRIQIDKPENLNPPTGANRAVAAATDDAKKKNIKNNGKGIAGNQFGQNFGKEDAAKKQAIVSAESFNRRVFIVKNDNGAARPYRVVDEDRARTIKNGSIIGVVTPDGKHRPIDAADFSPSDAIDELDKDPNFGKPMGPNGPSGPKTPPAKNPPEKPNSRENRMPTPTKDLTIEEQNNLQRMTEEWDELSRKAKDSIDVFVDSNNEDDILRGIRSYEGRIDAQRKESQAALDRWRVLGNASKSGAAFDHLKFEMWIKSFEDRLRYANDALERVRIKKQRVREAREAEIEERRQMETPEPGKPRTVGVSEIFEPKNPQPLTRTERAAELATDADQVKSLLDPNVTFGYADDHMNVSHGTRVVNGYYIPSMVPIGNAGINNHNDAVKHLINGGSLDDVPDELLRDAILDSVQNGESWGWGLTAGQPYRFLLVGDGGGLNNLRAAQSSNQYGGTYIVLDEKTGRKYIVKSPTAFDGEFANELYGAFGQQLLGLHAGRIRVSGYDPLGYSDTNLPIVVEHFDDVVRQGVDGRGDDFDYDWDITLASLEDLSSPSRQMTLLMDDVMRNPDRHWENWLYVDRLPISNDLESAIVVPIDNGASGGWGPSDVSDVAETKNIIKSYVAGDQRVTQELKQLFARIDVERAFLALDELEETISGSGSDNLGQRVNDEIALSEITSKPAAERLRNLITAIQQLQGEGYFNV